MEHRMKTTRKPRSDMLAETRVKLIATAHKAFANMDYANASMDDLTAEIGLTRGTLYHYFDDENDLLEAIIAKIDYEVSHRLNGIST